MITLRLRFMTTLAVGLFLFMVTAPAQGLKNTGVKADPVAGGVVITYTSDTGHSYVLYRGDTITSITNPVATAQGEAGVGSFTNSLGSAQAFFRVGAVSQLPSVFFPVTNATVLSDATMASITIGFTKLFTGRLTYQTGGTALSSSGLNVGDYMALPGYLDLQGAASATIPILLVPSDRIEDNRTLILTFTEPDRPPAPYVLDANRSCELTITSDTAGVYLGTLTVTNDFLLSPQSLKVGIRKSAVNGTAAFFDTSRSSFFGGPFSIPVSLLANKPLQFTGGVSGTFTNRVIPRPLSWTLTFGTVTQTNSALAAPFTLQVSGLSGSGRSVEAKGTFFLNAAN